jgi:hypothetical protein
MSFNEDLPFGQLAENKVALIYQNQGYKVQRSIGNVKEYDMVISEGVEVKHDRKATKTGNYFIELKCRGQWSGLSTSKARKWVLCTEEGEWEVETSILKNWVKMYGTDKNGKMTLTKGGDELQSEGVLIDYNWVKALKKL